ncbi:putative K domain, type 1 superfamily protein [Helianthus debilis subsp. tardiflorus]
MSSGRYMAYSSHLLPRLILPVFHPQPPPSLSNRSIYRSYCLNGTNLAPLCLCFPIAESGWSIKILRVSTLLENASVLDQSGLEHAVFLNGGANRWTSPLQSEMPALSAQSWLGSQGSSSGLVVKRTMRVDIPVATYPNFNFVGRLLGPRGNSLKRVEASTDCREEMMRGKPGFEHLNEPLHILVEAELPVDIIDARLMQTREILEDLLRPVVETVVTRIRIEAVLCVLDETHDFYKKQQLRELAMLKGTLHEETVQMSGSVSPFNNSLGMKRAKTTG